MLLAVANRPLDNNTTFTTGGDVSRFQRRTVPGRPEDRAAAAMKSLGAAFSGQPGMPVTGPAVRVARGNNITVVPVGAR